MINIYVYIAITSQEMFTHITRDAITALEMFTQQQLPQQGEGGGLITFIHHAIRYTDTTDITQNLINPDTTVK